jgi:hypothetical protein
MIRCLCLACLMCVCIVIGCGGDDNNEPVMTGNYRGTMQDSLVGRGTITVTIIQNGENLRGTWQSLFADPTNNNGGSLTGTIHRPSVPHPNISLLLQPANPTTCPFQVTGTLITPVEMTGTYVAVNCSRVETGTLDVTRQ